MNKITNFKTRLDIPLFQSILKLAKNFKTPVYSLIQKALKKLLEDYKNGLIKIDNLSDFLKRETSEKKEYYVALDCKLKIKLRRLAFTFFKSQAEVLRIALEYYVYVIHCAQGIKICKKYQYKNRHRHKTANIALVIYELFSTKTTRIKMLGKTKPYKFHFY